MDIATLGLTIENGQAVQAAQQTGAALDALGQKGDEVAAKVEKVGTAARATAKEHTTLVGATAASTREMGALAAMQAELTGKMGEHTFAVGRLERSLESLVAEMTGVNDTAALAATSLAKFGLGEIESLGILAGLAAVVALYDKLTESARAAGEEAEAAIAKINEAVSSAANENANAKLTAMLNRIEQGQATTVDNKHHALRIHEESQYAPGNYEGGLADMRAHRAALQDQLDHANPLAIAAIGNLKNQIADLTNRIAPLAEAEEHITNLLANPLPLHTGGALPPVHTTVQGPKHLAESAAALAKARFDDLMKELDETRASLIRILPEGVKPGTMDVFGFFNQTNPLDEKTIARGAASELGRQPNDFRDTLDRAAVMQAQFDATNAARELHGQKALKPTKDLEDAKKAAADMGSAMIDAVTHSNRSWEQQRQIIAEIVKLMKEAGVESKDMAPSKWQTVASDASSAMRTAADTINLFGSNQRAQQYGNILNTSANAVDDITSGHWGQATVAILSLGKQIVGLGHQSHDAARQVAEASEAVKTMLAALQASVGHDGLGALLAQAQSAYDAQKKQINDDLSGKKKEKERNADLAQLDALYAQQRQQIVQQYGEKQVLDEESLQARLLRAKGLTYQADVADLAVKQQQEYNQAVIDGRDATYLATLAQVQLAEKTALANQAITQFANSPTGFFAERYFGQFASPVTALPASIATAQAGGAGSNNTSVTAQTINITVPGTSDPTATAHAVVRVFRTIRDQTVGSSGTIADAMEVM